jgi:hypothetical protein
MLAAKNSFASAPGKPKPNYQKFFGSFFQKRTACFASIASARALTCLSRQRRRGVLGLPGCSGEKGEALVVAQPAPWCR